MATTPAHAAETPTPSGPARECLINIDLTADMGWSHTTIEKSPRLHAIVTQKIADVV